MIGSPTLFGSLNATRRRAVTTMALNLLSDSPFRRRREWSAAVLIWRDGDHRIESRGSFITWLKNAGLDNEARDLARARVPFGHVLCWLEADRPDVAMAGLIQIDLAGEAMKLKLL